MIDIMRKIANSNRPDRWKGDIEKSVDMYNNWFMNFAPAAFRATRIRTTKDVERALIETDYLRDVSAKVIRRWPGVLPTLRMSTCPPLAVDRLIGLSGVADSVVKRIEKEQLLPVRLIGEALDIELDKIGRIVEKMADPDIFVWLEKKMKPTELEVHRAATIVADRLCGSVANPIIRNAQEKRQLEKISKWLESKGYRLITEKERQDSKEMPSGTFSLRRNISVKSGVSETATVNIPIDVAIMPRASKAGSLPILVEAKSAGDFTNTNKRRKEEAQKVTQLRATYGADEIHFVLFLCGYFDSGYLGYEAAEGIDWVWEHRIDDLAEFGI